jgi:hypothetical protein
VQQLPGTTTSVFIFDARYLQKQALNPATDQFVCKYHAHCTSLYGATTFVTGKALASCSLTKNSGGHAIASVKFRSGFDDTSLFEENLLAAQVCEA